MCRSMLLFLVKYKKAYILYIVQYTTCTNARYMPYIIQFTNIACGCFQVFCSAMQNETFSLQLQSLFLPIYVKRTYSYTPRDASICSLAHASKHTHTYLKPHRYTHTHRHKKKTPSPINKHITQTHISLGIYTHSVICTETHTHICTQIQICTLPLKTTNKQTHMHTLTHLQTLRYSLPHS